MSKDLTNKEIQKLFREVDRTAFYMQLIIYPLIALVYFDKYLMPVISAAVDMLFVQIQVLFIILFSPVYLICGSMCALVNITEPFITQQANRHLAQAKRLKYLRTEIALIGFHIRNERLDRKLNKLTEKEWQRKTQLIQNRN